MYQSSCYSTFMPAFSVVYVLVVGHSNMYVVVSSFILHFSNNIRCGASFHLLVYHLYIVFGELSVKIFGSFLKSCLFKSSFMFGITVLYHMFLLQIFSPSLWTIVSFS